MPEWKEYEIAVSKFIAAIDPKAKVTYDASLPDKHTSHPRQRDVFIESTACNLFPIKILVSCKKYKRKLNQQDIDAFNGELISSGAHKGVIYSYSGFNKNAIEKCKVLGISCCKLYQNEPPDIPEILPIPNVFACYPQLYILVIDYLDSRWGFNLWGDIFNESITNLENYTALDEIVRVYKECEKQSVEMVKKGSLPINYTGIISLSHENKEITSINVRVSCYWKMYQGNMKATLVNGSYSFSEGYFIGSHSLPIVDTKSSDPGPEWTLLEKPPNQLDKSYAMYILFNGNVKEGLKDTLSNKPIKVVKESKEPLPSVAGQ